MQILSSVQSTAQVHPEKLTKAMMAAAESRGAHVKIGSVQSIITDESPATKVTGAYTIWLLCLLNISTNERASLRRYIFIVLRILVAISNTWIWAVSLVSGMQFTSETSEVKKGLQH